MKTTMTRRPISRPSRKRTLPVASVGLCLAAVGAVLAGADAVAAQERDFEWSGLLEAGQTLEVKGVNGTLEAGPAEGAEARLRAEKEWDDDDPDEVRIEVVEHDDGVTVCAVYPHPRKRNRCEPGARGGMDVEDNDVRVDFSVRVPTGVRFRGRTVNGEVRVRGLESDVDVSTVNGDVDVSTRGVAQARTVNGSIEARMGRAPSGPLTFSTVNGSIELDVPRDLDADLDARWVNGGLETDLPVSLVGRLRRDRARGRLGDGGPMLKLKTVNGSIRIR